MTDDFETAIGRYRVADRDTDAELARKAVRARLFGGTVERTRLGKYTVQRLVGVGGMGKVYLAHDRELDRPVALKLLKGSAWTKPSDHDDRLWNEARTLARVSHRNVVSVYEVGDSDLGVFVAMEFIRGRTLRQWMDDDPGVSPTIEALRDAGRGLAAVHAAGILHRDFKPDNVLIGSDGRVCVVDFGIAQDTSSSQLDDRAEAESLLVSGPAGTPAYMAPERLRGARADVSSDVYSFCVCAWEALTGYLPDPRSNAPPPDPRNVVPKHLRSVLHRGLDHDPRARPHSIEGLLDAFEQRRASRTPFWIGSLMLAALAGGASMYGSMPSAASPLAPSGRAFAVPMPARHLHDRIEQTRDSNAKFVGRNPARTLTSPAEYAQRAAKVRGSHPGLVIADAIGGVSTQHDRWTAATLQFLDGVQVWADRNHGGSFPADVIGIHLELRDLALATRSFDSAGLHTAAIRLARWRDDHAAGRPLWVTRLACVDPSNVAVTISPSCAEPYATRAALLLLAGGIDDIVAPLPLPLVRTQLRDFEIDGVLPGLPANVWAIALSSPNDRRAVVAWDDQVKPEPREVELPFAPLESAEAFAGARSFQVPPGPLRLSLSETPTCVVWKARATP